MGVYLSDLELDEKMNKVLLEFPEVIQRTSIGQSYLGNDINCYVLGLNLQNDFTDLNRPGILVNGAHHARELTSISMSIYYILRILYLYAADDLETTQMLKDSIIYVIPVVNIDGFKTISQGFKETG